MEAYDPLGVMRLFDYVAVSRQHWRDFIEAKDQPADIKALKEHTRKGRPLGSDLFLAKLEEKLGQALKVKRRGRPKKEATQLVK